jgi:two-component system LytT family response regulator
VGLERRTVPVRTVIVDDEPLARSNIRTLLREDPEILLVGEYGSGEAALAEIPKAHPDLAFLDVQMPECDGFDVVERLGACSPPAIIFVTAYDQYALRAFETGALDYLLKPFDDLRFQSALKRAKERVQQHRFAHNVADRFIIKSAGQILFLKVSDVEWIEGADYYACLHAGGATHLLRRSLSDLEKELRSAFCRIHRSTLVNVNRVRGLKLNREGEYEILLHSGTALRISRRYRKHLQSRLGIGDPGQ